jgi:hypothetical protein
LPIVGDILGRLGAGGKSFLALRRDYTK